VAPEAGFYDDPALGLRVQIGKVTKALERQEVALQVFDARLDDALLVSPELQPVRILKGA
jgi:hypothetical protein